MTIPNSIIYLNGQFLPEQKASLSIHERASTFADGVYEVIRVVHGKPCFLAAHMQRLQQSLLGIELDAPIQHIPEAIQALIDVNGLQNCKIYLQYSRGAWEREHIVKQPAPAPPTLLMIATPQPLPTPEHLPSGKAILLEDLRWHLCQYKTLLLLPATLLKTKAHRAGADEAILFRNHQAEPFVTEGSATNVFVIVNGILITHPLNNWVLPGITRKIVLEQANLLNIPTEEKTFTPDELKRADACFITGTTTGIKHITHLDKLSLGNETGKQTVCQLHSALLQCIFNENN